MEAFLEAVDTYFKDRIERNNITLELNCSFQKTDIFEPINFYSRLCDDDSQGTVERLPKPFEIVHHEGEIISIVFIDARRDKKLD